VYSFDKVFFCPCVLHINPPIWHRAAYSCTESVLPLCCYGKVLDFMIKKTLHSQKTLDHKTKLTHSENAKKIRCNANH